MTDLMHLMSGLVDRQGKLQIPGIYDHVAKLEEAEAKLYQPIDFDMVSKITVWLFLVRCQTGFC